MDSIVELKDVVKEYPLGKLVVRALCDVDLTIEKGEFTVIAGPSGSGKTTLLNMVGCVDVPTSGSVLVAGGRLEDRMLLRQMLQKVRFRVCEAVSNEELALVYQMWHPQLICVDITMPIIDNLHAVRQIHDLPGGDKVPVIAITGSITAEERDMILDVGCSEVIVKPVDADQLLEKIGRRVGVNFIYR